MHALYAAYSESFLEENLYFALQSDKNVLSQQSKKNRLFDQQRKKDRLFNWKQLKGKPL